jgi:hypothetical protein
MAAPSTIGFMRYTVKIRGVNRKLITILVQEEGDAT